MRGLRLGFGVGVGGGVVSAYPSLLMDFVPMAGVEVERSSLSIDFLSQSYSAFQRDTSDPAGFTNFQVWS